MVPVPVRILCAGRVTVVIVWVALRLGCGLAVRRRARGCRGLAVVVLVRVAGCGDRGMFPVGAASAGYGVVPIRAAGGRFLPTAARGGAAVVIVGVAGRLGCGLAVCRRARRRRGLAVVVVVGVALGGGRRRGALPASVCGLRAVVVRGRLRGAPARWRVLARGRPRRGMPARSRRASAGWGAWSRWRRRTARRPPGACRSRVTPRCRPRARSCSWGRSC